MLIVDLLIVLGYCETEQAECVKACLD